MSTSYLPRSPSSYPLPQPANADLPRSGRTASTRSDVEKTASGREAKGARHWGAKEGWLQRALYADAGRINSGRRKERKTQNRRLSVGGKAFQRDIDLLRFVRGPSTSESEILLPLRAQSGRKRSRAGGRGGSKAMGGGEEATTAAARLLQAASKGECGVDCPLDLPTRRYAPFGQQKAVDCGRGERKRGRRRRRVRAVGARVQFLEKLREDVGEAARPFWRWQSRRGSGRSRRAEAPLALQLSASSSTKSRTQQCRHQKYRRTTAFRFRPRLLRSASPPLLLRIPC